MKNVILSLVKQGKYTEARKEIVNINTVDIAELFEDIEQIKLHGYRDNSGYAC